MKVTNPPIEDLSPCPVRGILTQVGDKWSTLVILDIAAHDGPLRFSELKRNVKGISQRMLTETVRDLERNGILTRTMYLTIPPKVEYALTQLGQSLVTPIRALVSWARDHRPEIMGAREHFDAGRPAD